MNYKQTKQFSEFQCVGTACINNCCHDWLIAWSREGVEKLKSAPGSSDKLTKLIQSAFLPRKDGKYGIILTDKGRCPFQLDNGLCIIQKELGEEYLSGDCAAFPRSYISVGQSVYCSCGSSCPAVLQELIESDNAAAILTANNAPDIRGNVSTLAGLPEDFKARSAIKNNRELLNFFYDIISDRRFNTEVNIVRGAVAAEKLTETVENGNAKKIVNVMSALKNALCEESFIRLIEDIQPENEAKLRMLTDYTESLFGTGLADLFKNSTGNADPARFAYAEERLAVMFDGKRFWFRNIVLNLLLEFAVPFRYIKKSIYNNFAEFAVVTAVLKMCVMAAVMSDKLSIETRNGRAFEFHGLDCVTGLCSIVIRQISQNGNAVETLLEKFNSGKVTPRDIGMLIK